MFIKLIIREGAHMSVTKAGPVSVDLSQLVKVGHLGPPVSGWGLPSQQLTKVNRAAGSQGPTGQRPGGPRWCHVGGAPERAPASLSRGGSSPETAGKTLRGTKMCAVCGHS